MSEKDNILSILNAIDKINLKPKKKKINNSSIQKYIPKLNQDSIIPSDIDSLILEAEKYKKSLLKDSQTISDSNQTTPKRDESILILTDNYTSVKNNKEIIELTNKIKNLKKSAEALRAEISILKENNVSFTKTKNTYSEDPNYSKDALNNTKETLRSIYKQVEHQKKIFLELKNYSFKVERDSSVYKENYERLIIENNELKLRLKTAKEQIVIYESNKTELLSSLDQLNAVLVKSNIVGRISPRELLSRNSDVKAVKKTETID